MNSQKNSKYDVHVSHDHLVGGNCAVSASFNSCVLVATVLGIGGITYLFLTRNG